ncbi:hypothetical protein D9M71_821000 [compost metagenome]
MTALVTINHAVGDVGRRLIATIYKNGVAYASAGFSANNQFNSGAVVTALVYMNGSTDYVEIYGRADTAANTTLNVAAPIFGAFLIGT